MAAKKKPAPKRAASTTQTVYIVQSVRNGLNCFPTAEKAVAGAKVHCASHPDKGDVIVYKVTPLHRVSPTTGAKVSAAGTLTIEPKE